MKVFLLVLEWNNPEDTSECLESLLRHEPGCRVVLIDNGSTPENRELLRRRFPDLPMLENGENLGFAGGNNPGIRYALGHGATHIGLLNNDTVVRGPFVEPLLRTLEAHPRTAAVSPAIRVWGNGASVWSGGGRIPSLYPRPLYYDRLLDNGSYAVQLLSACALLVRAEVFDEVGYLDERFFFYQEDVDFSLRLARAGYELRVEPGSTVFHKVSRSSGAPASPFASYHLLRGTLRLMRKHYGRGPARALAPLYLVALSGKMAANALFRRDDSRREVWSAIGRAWRDWLRADD